MIAKVLRRLISLDISESEPATFPRHVHGFDALITNQCDRITYARGPLSDGREHYPKVHRMVIPYDPRRSALYTPEKSDTVFQSGVGYSPLQLAVEAARLAYYRAEVSPAQMQRLGEALARAGFGAPEMFIGTGTGAAGFGSLRATDGTMLLALRGTQAGDLRDIKRDLGVRMVAWTESAGRVHAGFASGTRSLLPQIRQWVDRTGPDSKKLIVTGHSLGAAMATLTASVLPVEWLVTLGSPRVGDLDFIRTLQAAHSVRIVDCCDLVTHVPPPLTSGGYTHVPTCTYLTQDGQPILDPAEALISADRSSARRRYFARYSWRLGNVLLRPLADHAPINYARAFFS